MNRFKWLTALLLLSSFATLRAQDSKPVNLWLSAGAGRTSYASGMVAAGYEPKQSHSAVIARYVVSGQAFPADDPRIRASEVGLLYGYRFHTFRFGAGLSTMWGMNKGRLLYTEPRPFSGSGRHYERLPFNTLSVPVEIRYVHFWNIVGLGLTAFGSLNQYHSMAGANVSLYIGHKAK